MRANLQLAALAAVSSTLYAEVVGTQWSTLMATSIMSRSQGIMTGSGGSSELLQAGFTQKAFTAFVEQYPNDNRTAAIKQYIEASAVSVAPFVLNATYDGTGYPMDRLSNGNAMIALLANGDSANSSVEAAVDALRQSIDLNPRNTEGGLWYYVYSNWSYLDGMYSLAPFDTLYTLTASPLNASALADVELQLDLLWQHNLNASTGLLVHGYDESKTASWADPVTGASPHVWGRSLGWYTMALVDTLEILNSAAAATGSSSSCSTPAALTSLRSYIADKLQSLAAALLAAVDPATGGWWQVMDAPGAAGNYIESSGSAMFAYALLKSARLGYLNGTGDAAANAVQVGTRAQALLTSEFVVNNGNGTVGYNGTVGVCSLNSTASYEYYTTQPLSYNSVLGSAAYILASLEVERLRL
ncbi:Six-hairpin glycosidase-like protein [Xylariales sp. PMI_506]|nr:Six-hairpin glycosidase-like protein [Xylariales sp. PMI_506]